MVTTGLGEGSKDVSGDCGAGLVPGETPSSAGGAMSHGQSRWTEEEEVAHEVEDQEVG